MAAELRWDPPGPGAWRRDRVHFPAPATAHVEETFPAIEEGFRYTAERYGWLMDHIALRCVNRVLYGSLVTVTPDQLANRFDTAERVFVAKLWRDDVARWDGKVKRESLDAHRALIAVEPSSLSDGALVEYLRRCHEHHYAMWLQHHVFNGAHWVPVGDFFAATSAWTGLPPERLAPLMTGASPVSRGHCAELDGVRDALASSDKGQKLVASEREPGDVLDALCDLGDGVGDAVRAWLVVTGYRLIEGFDISFPYALERPALLVAAISRACVADSATHALENRGAVVEVRDAVPAEHRADFDERYEEARHAFHVRDERGIYSDATAAGIVRRAWLAAGERLAAAGALPKADLAIDATFEELRALLEDGAGADFVDELRSRAAFRATGGVDAPEFLGEPPSGPPPLDGVPPAVLRMMAAIQGAPDNEVQSEPDENASHLDGIGASPGYYRGIARIVRGPDDLARIEDGDVMVTVTTGEAFNIAISIVGALVTDVGGLMSHAGITTREFGIPSVLGTKRATELIPEGAMVEVDGNGGVVRWS